MSCEQTREQLMELELSAFDGVEHLRTCVSCRAFADELRRLDGAMAEHVESFAARGDFRAEWVRARAAARRPSRILYSTAGLGLVALAAGVLLMLRPPAPDNVEPSPVVTAPVVTAPAATPAPPVVAPAPLVVAPPGPAISPPAPARAPPPPPPRRPAATLPPDSPSAIIGPSVSVEPERDPTPVVAAPPRAARPTPDRPEVAGGAPVVVHIDPDLSGIRAADLTCGSTRSKVSRAGDTLRFDGVPEGPCQIVFRGSDVSAVVTGGSTWRLTRIDGVVVLVRY